MPVIENPAPLFESAGDTGVRTQVCVVGSGFAGATVAVALAGAGVDVVVLESGSRAPDHRVDAMLDRIDVSGGVELNFGFSRQLGGASNLWAGRVAPFEAIDFERRDWIPDSGWPISIADLDPYYVRAGRLLGLPGHDRFHDAAVAPPGFANGQGLEVKSFQWAREPFDAGRYLRAAAGDHEHLRVCLNAAVVRLEETGDTRAVETAVVALPGGGEGKLRAEAFVVAAGGIQTPRLLLNSTGVRRDGIGGDRGNVGRYFSTHPKANMATLVLERSISTRHPLFTDLPVGGGVIRHGLGFGGDIQRRRRLLNHYVQVLPFLEGRANKLFEAVKGSDAFNSPLIDRAPLISGYLAGLGKVVFDRIGRLGGLQRRARKFILRAFLDQYPDAENRVTLSPRKDARGMPLASVRWRFSERDRSSVLDFFDHLEREMTWEGKTRLDYGRLRSVEEWPLVAIHSHFMGTTRMGDDPRTSVTDADCRVHGSDNLFVAGSSLFPTYGYANPVYTIVALALRLADRLAARAGRGART